MTRAEIIERNAPVSRDSYELDVVESFRKFTVNTTGLLHTLNIPPDAIVRNLWIVAGGLSNKDVGGTNDIDWAVETVIRFRRQNNVIAELPVMNANVNGFDVNQISMALPQASDSFQPNLRIIAYDALFGAGAWKKLDVPAFRFMVSADRVEMEVTRMRTGAATFTEIVTGLRCVSEYPVTTIKP